MLLPDPAVVDVKWLAGRIRALGPAGDEFLEECIARRDDRWLAWVAYEVKYLEQKASDTFCLVDEARAIEDAKKAPPFPGWIR